MPFVSVVRTKMGVMTVSATFDVPTVMALAGPRAYARGAVYCSDGRVEQGEITDDRVRAVVRGSMPYSVELKSDADEPRWQCTCPAAEDGSFCKHCVAVALSVVGSGPHDGPSGLALSPGGFVQVSAEDVTGGRELSDYVAGLDRDRLVELVVAQIDADWRLKERLTAEAQAAAGEGPSIETWRGRIDRVFSPYGGFVPYREAAGWASEVAEVIDALSEVCDAGHPDATVVLAEHAHRRADESVGHVDDSDGWLSDISYRLSDLHLRACQAGSPEPVALARGLVELELTSELDGFHRAAAAYATVLGEEGLAEYRRLLEPASVQLILDVGPEADEDFERYGTEFAVRNAKIGWALGTGNPDELIAVMADDLRLPDDYLEIAGALARAGRTDEAVEWARRGLVEHGGRPWQLSRLRDFLGELLRSSGDVDASVELFWEAFKTAPSLAAYRRLLDEVPDSRHEWSARCVDELRSKAANQNDEVPRWLTPRSQALIEILLFEGDADGAWQVARDYGCDRRMMMTLARTREAAHPLDAIDVYAPEVFVLIDQKKKGAYRAAVDLMSRIKILSVAAGAPERFEEVLHRARTEHRAKRNLRAMLDEQGWPDSR